MSTHSYSLRNRLGSTTTSSKTPSNSAHTKPPYRSPRKPPTHTSALQLRHVIGTTTTTPSGLTSCESTNSFAYCAGSVAVLAELSSAGSITYRYFKARPTAVAVNVTSSYYDSPSSNNTPTRRSSVFPPRKGLEDGQVRSFGREWLDEAGASTWSARERIKAVTCVSLSADGRLLAVGETGYNPRVLLFSTAANSSTDVPLTIITEHSIGVRSVAFSPDSKYLATLGDVNDGFLYIWTVNTRNGEVKLQSTNKCTTNVCDMAWCGNNVVTVGTRHIKIWQVLPTLKASPQKRARLRMEGEQIPSPGPKPLLGRNCVLGKMVDATFTSVTAVSLERAVVCTDDGCLCLLDLSNGNASLSTTQHTETCTAAVSYHSSTEKLVWPHSHGMRQQHVTNLFQNAELAVIQNSDEAHRLRPRTSKHSLIRESLGISQPERTSTIALACLTDRAISIDAKGSIRWLPMDEIDTRLDVNQLSSHRDLIRGVQRLPEEAGLGSFFTWARDGETRFWSSEGAVLRIEHCELDQIYDEDEIEINELKIIRYAAGQKQFVTGDRYGVIRLINRDPWVVCHTIRAHSADVTGVAVHDETSVLATCGRDRMVQLFQIRGGNMVLLQTSDDHISAVHHVLFSDDGQRLLSCSADRTVIVRDRIERETSGETIAAFLSTRIITLKGSPLSMTLLSNEQNMLFVSTMDRYIVKVDITTGATLDTFKVSDKDTDDTATLNSVCSSVSHTVDQPSILAGYSSTDKSIRVYDMQKGVLLGRDAGHTEGVSDMILFDNEARGGSTMSRTIVSTGMDSTIMIWTVVATSQPFSTSMQDLSQSLASLSYESDSTPAKPSPVTLPPLRKVLSKMEVAELARQTSPTRDSSPNAIKRKTSRLALSASIEETNENTSLETRRTNAKEQQAVLEKRSPSPPAVRPMSSMRLRKQRSKAEFSTELDTRKSEWSGQSPSPPTMPASLPTTPKHMRVSNRRLRRPPSIPSDMRMQASIPQRRQSMVASTESGSIVAASEATCRMLKTYRKKLQLSRGDIDLDDVEKELEAVLSTIRQRQERTVEMRKGDENKAMSIAEASHEIDGLATLLGKTNMGATMDQGDTHSIT